MASYRYVIPGHPEELTHYPRPAAKNKEAQFEVRRIRRVDLEAIHGDRPLFSTPMHIDFNFYFAKAPRAKHPYHVFYPALHSMVLNYIHFIKGILITDYSLVIEESGHKYYSDWPHTEIIITPIVNNGKRDKD